MTRSASSSRVASLGFNPAGSDDPWACRQVWPTVTLKENGRAIGVSDGKAAPSPFGISRCAGTRWLTASFRLEGHATPRSCIALADDTAAFLFLPTGRFGLVPVHSPGPQPALHLRSRFNATRCSRTPLQRRSIGHLAREPYRARRCPGRCARSSWARDASSPPASALNAGVKAHHEHCCGGHSCRLAC